MKTLLVLRHAKSSWDNPTLSDFQRPLNVRGKRDAPRMGRLLRREDLVPELIISSSAARALATAEAVADASGFERELLHTRQLYHADPEEYIEVLNDVDDTFARVMVVGHNPGIEELVAQLTGAWTRMPTGALAQIRLPIESWDELEDDTEGELVATWYPKELDD